MNPPAPISPADQGILALVPLLQRWRRLILWFVGIVAVGSVIVSLLLPKWYRAEAALLVSREEFGFGLVPSMPGLEDMPFAGLTVGGRTAEVTRRVLAILESRTMMESVVRRFDLLAVYDSETRTDAIRALRQLMVVSLEDHGTVVITIEDRDPHQASDMVNFVVAELNERGTALNTERGRAVRAFIGNRYNESEEKLRRLEEANRVFQEEHHVVSFTAQTEAAIEVAAGLVAEITKLEVELGVQEQLLGKNHSRLRLQQTELAEFRRHFNDLMGMEGASDGAGTASHMFIPFTEAPAIGLQALRLQRELEIQTTIYATLAAIYEQAKIEEIKDTPSIQVLDPAIPPERKYRPRRALIVLVSTGLALVFGVGGALLVESWRARPAA